jgi:hypothetical protein
VRHQLHAEHFGSEVAGFVHRFGDLYAATLAAPSGVDLRLDHNSTGARTEQIFGNGFGLILRCGHRPTRHAYAVLLKDCFCLILMDFHNDGSSIKERKDPACAVALRAANF